VRLSNQGKLKLLVQLPGLPGLPAPTSTTFCSQQFVPSALVFLTRQFSEFHKFEHSCVRSLSQNKSAHSVCPWVAQSTWPGVNQKSRRLY
jgi:hypothetical protein